VLVPGVVDVKTNVLEHPRLVAQRIGRFAGIAGRHALEIAAHNKRQEDLRADAARLAANPEYQAEIRAVREELDELRAW
jgi:hypothetical protein